MPPRPGSTPVERLVYRSNLLGTDARITNTGGGNTSAKLTEKDVFGGQPVEVLWVKGSGGDLRTARKENFASLYLDSVLSLEALYQQTPASERGPKSAVEDRMVEMYPHCTFNLNPRASSIDTPLHAFVPFKHVDHTHPNAVIAIAASKNAEALTREIYGDRVIYTPWQRPGFDLGLILRDLCQKHPQAQGVILGQHGLINWADDDRACYELSLQLIEQAALFIEKHDRQGDTFGGERHQPLPPEKRDAALVALLPWLRGQLARATGKTADRHRRVQRRHPALRQQPRRPAPGRTRHELPRPLPAHQDQAALCRLGPPRPRRRGRPCARSSPSASCNTARTTPTTTPGTSAPTRPPCATPTPRSSSFPGWAWSPGARINPNPA